jgi:hypothetical protein
MRPDVEHLERTNFLRDTKLRCRNPKRLDGTRISVPDIHPGPEHVPISHRLQLSERPDVVGVED